LTKTIDAEICRVLERSEMPEGMTQSAVISRIIDNYKEEQEFIVRGY
jgi:hypothetical protein